MRCTMKSLNLKLNASCLVKPLLIAGLALPAIFPFSPLAQLTGSTAIAADAKSKKKTRKTPALRAKVYNQLSRAQKLADDGKVNEGLDVLKRLESRAATMNSYELAMMWNFYGFIHYGNENIKEAVGSFSKVVAIKNIPESLEKSTLFSLAQLSMQVEDYNKALSYIDRWSSLQDGAYPSKAYVLKANANYAMKNYAESLKNIALAVSQEEGKGKLPKENWLVLKRALHYELKQPKEVTKVSEKLVRLYGKPQYWVELANMYGEVGESDKQLAVMEAAYQQGFVNKKSDFLTLAQLYFFKGAPYKAAKLMSEQLEANVLEKDVKTLQFLAQAWTTAKEHKKAIPVLQSAAKISKDGNMDVQLAEVFINLENWQQAIDAANSAEKKGGLDNPGNVNIARGMAYFNLKNYAKSIVEFNAAKDHKKVNKMAKQWLKYVESEKKKNESIHTAMLNIGS